jgi:lipoprotein-releasing system ATP-binding protein
MLEANGIVKSYGKLQVLKGVNLTLNQGEVVALVGASGAGKSTLLQILGLLDEPDSGSVRFQGQDLSGLKEHQKAEFRSRSLGFVFQFHHLLPEFNALENVTLPALIAGKSQAEAQTRAHELLKHLNVDERWSHKPSELSGGEQQRVAVARALINAPQLILADEPTGNLDSRNSEVLFELIRSLAAEFGVGVLVTTHNEVLAATCNRRLRMTDGLIESN